MPTGDAVQQRPSAEQEMAKFGGYTMRNGEVIDPKAEDLNPVEGKDLSEEEQQAIAARETDATTEKKAATTDAVDVDGEAEEEAPKTEDAPEDDAEDDDTRTITVAEAKKMAATAAGKRIGELKKQVRNANARADAARDNYTTLETRLAALEGKGLTGVGAAATGGAKGEGAPDAKDFDYGELDPKYVKAIARWEAKQELADQQRTQDEARNRDAAQRDAEKVKEDLATFSAAGIELYDDFEETVMQAARDKQFPISATLGRLMLASEVGPRIAYHLATNPKEARAVFGKAPAEQAAYFGRMEAKLSPAAPAAPKEEKGKAPVVLPANAQSKAPLPLKIQAKGGSGKAPATGATRDFAAFEAQAMARTRR